jgi:hypothetical protein
MTDRPAKTSPSVYARVAGILYLIVIIAGAFAEFFVRSRLIVPGDAAATAGNIMASQWLFRIGFVSDIVANTCYFLLAFALYVLLKPVNKNIALLFVLLVAISVAVYCVNMLNHFAALQLLSGAEYLKAFEADQLQALVLFFLNMHALGYAVAVIFFGGWLFPLGYLVYKSGFFPKTLGVLLMIAPVGYLMNFLTSSLFPEYEAISYPGLAVSTIAELSFCLWLLLKGVDVQKWNSNAPAST